MIIIVAVLVAIIALGPVITVLLRRYGLTRYNQDERFIKK